MFVTIVENNFFPTKTTTSVLLFDKRRRVHSNDSSTVGLYQADIRSIDCNPFHLPQHPGFFIGQELCY